MTFPTSTIKSVAIAAVFLAEIAFLTAISYGARDLPADGIMVGEDDIAIETHDQQGWGAFSVDRVVSPVDGWVVLRADWGDGTPAEIVGAAPIVAGENRNVAVVTDVTGAYPAGMFASVVADKGEVGAFEYTTGDPGDRVSLGGGGMGDGGMGGGDGPAMSGPADKPLLVDGEAESVRFGVAPFDIVHTMAEANIGGAFLDPSGNAVSVRRVDVPAASWVAIIKGRVGDEPSRIIGTAAVPAGHTAAVTVPLDEATEAVNVTALLCADLGAQGVPEIDSEEPARSPDAPYIVVSYFVQIAVLPQQ